MEFRYLVNDELVAVRVEKSGAEYRITIGERTFTVSAAQLRDGALTFTLDGQRRVAHVAADGPRRWVAFNSQPFVLTIPQAESKAKRGKGRGAVRDSLEAQMPGLVRKVLASVGDHVERGQALLVLEAMKMEIRLGAPHAGVVEQVRVSEGQSVERGQVLVEVRGG